MAPELLDIQPQELKFLYELKKQSSCTVRLINKFNDYVAFKVKTTSPKKYCVRPNVGIIEPKSFCDFTVTMQAPKVALPDMVCKDKFLVQSTVVPAGTTDDDITSSMFARDNDTLVEEVKLRVVLLSPPNSPILSPINTILTTGPVHETPIPKDNVMHKLGSSTQNKHVAEDVVETKSSNSKVVKPAKNFEYNTIDEMEEPAAEDEEYELMKGLEDPSKHAVFKATKSAEGPEKNGIDRLMHELHPTNNWDIKSLDHVKNQERPKYDVDHKTLNHVKDEGDSIKEGEFEVFKRMKHLEQSSEDVNTTMKDVKESEKVVEHSTMDDVEVSVKELNQGAVLDMNKPNLVKDIEEMKSKLNILESKLTEAETTISKLTEERNWTDQQSVGLRKELALLRSKGGDRKVQVGFPFLFVCMVSLVSIVLGYTIRC